jgi:hypothetical protein
MDWLLIDGIAPFFHGYRKKRVNWSKIPFSHLETGTGLKSDLTATMAEEFERFVTQAAGVGFNAVTLDDVAHLYDWPGYDPALRAKISQYRMWYRDLFALAARAGLRVFLTTDIMFYTAELAQHLGRNAAALAGWWQQALIALFADFPELAGLIMRFGESDGADVRQDFRSDLVLRTPRQVHAFLAGVLDVFEREDKYLIFRTWSVGAYPVGDLMWRRQTYDKVFGALSSSRLILSMKYGETDFFRFLPLNPHFFHGPHCKIIEFQARREYEGFGECPAFVGWEYERYTQALQAVPNVVGASVWCQTGGWGKFRRRTYLEDSSIWVELNAFVTVQLCLGRSCEQAVEQFCARFYADVAVQPFLQFLRLADEVIQDLLYIREMAERPLFFRRLRVPPLLHVYWDRLLINPLMHTLLRALIQDHRRAIDEGWRGLRTLARMQQLAEAYQLPQLGLQFQYDTFEILATARNYIFGGADPETLKRLQRLKKRYRSTYQRRYAIKIRTGSSPRHRHLTYLPLLLTLALRRQRGYRLIDHLFILKLPAIVYPLVKRWRRWLFPKYARKTGMGIETILK